MRRSPATRRQKRNERNEVRGSQQALMGTATSGRMNSTIAIAMHSGASDAMMATLVAITLIALARGQIRLAGWVLSEEHDGPPAPDH